MKSCNLENTLFLRGCIKKLNITCASAKNLFIQPLYSTKRYETNDSSRRIQKITALVSVSLDFMSKLNATRERERERNHREQIHPLENEKDEEEDSLTKTNFPPFKRVEFTIPLSHFDKILGHPRPLIQRNSKTPPPPFKSLH